MKIFWPVWHTSLETANLRTVIIVFRGIASLKTTAYLSRIQTFKLKAAVDLSVMDIFLKDIFLLFPWLFCHSSGFFILKNSLNRHDYMYQTQTCPETSWRKWDKQKILQTKWSVELAQCPMRGLWSSVAFWFVWFSKAQYRYRQPRSQGDSSCANSLTDIILALKAKILCYSTKPCVVPQQLFVWFFSIGNWFLVKWGQSLKHHRLLTMSDAMAGDLQDINQDASASPFASVLG